MVEVTASLGSNLEPRRHLSAAMKSLEKDFPGLQASPVYECRAVGFNGADFLNLVVAFRTALPFHQLRDRLRLIEEGHGRHRDDARFADRTLDIDILTYGDTVAEISGVRLPRRDITRFAFVLKPLSDLRPKGRHPELGASYAELWRTFPNKEEQPLREQPPL